MMNKNLWKIRFLWLERIPEVLLDEAHLLEGVPGRVGLGIFLVVDRNGRLENIPVDDSLKINDLCFTEIL